MTKRIVFLLLAFLAAVAVFAQGKLLPGMPAPLDPADIYAADRPGALSSVVKTFPPRVYVPNTESNTVSVIDPATYKVIETIQVGRLPLHVSPAYDITQFLALHGTGARP